MKDKSLYRLSYLYLLLPIICFYLSYLKIYISIPLVILLSIIIYKIFKEYDNKDIIISKKNLIIIFIFTIILCITAGLGGFFYQSSDYHYRNAIFRDMITKSFPVYYNNYNVYLDYYFGFWIIPALIGKLGLFISNEVAFNIGNIGLLIWASFGVVLTFIWIIKLFSLKNKKSIIKYILVFIFFSGLDILGIIVSHRYDLLNNLHLEWWGGGYQYSSVLTTLFWVFNQSICSWLITLMYFSEKKVNHFMLLILLALPYSPLPFCGLVILFFAKGVYLLIKSIKESHFKSFIKDVFSIYNIISFITILPIYYLFYSSNTASSGSGSFQLITEYLTFQGIFNELIFYFLEVGIFYILLFKYYKKDYLFHVIFISLIFIPYFKIGTGYDFSMRASIPLIVGIIYYILKFFNYYYYKSKDKTVMLSKYLLIIILLIGSITPLIEYLRATKAIIKNHKINVVADDIKSLELNPLEKNINFVTTGDNSIFFKYLVR